jgi:MOSC domain-containing protein YiiM
MQGTIIQISISPGGPPKRPIPAGLIAPLGIEGDAHAHPQFHGGPRQAILLIAAEVVEELQQRGYPVSFGSLGENLTTRAIDVRDLRIGDRLRAGGALLEITKPREPCSALDIYGPSIKKEIYDPRVKANDHTSPHWGMSGFYLRVVEAGPACPGDIIAVVAQVA